MLVVDRDLDLYLSGGIQNTNPLESLGGRKSLKRLNEGEDNFIFNPLNGNTYVSGIIDYCCIYIMNEHSTDTAYNVRMFIDRSPFPKEHRISIGLDPVGKNGIAQEIVIATQEPTGIVFKPYRSSGDYLPVGDLGPGEFSAIWVKRVISPSGTIKSVTNFGVVIQAG